MTRRGQHEAVLDALGVSGAPKVASHTALGDGEPTAVCQGARRMTPQILGIHVAQYLVAVPKAHAR